MDTSSANELQKLSEHILQCVEHWKQGNDIVGYEHFIRFLDVLDQVIEDEMETLGEWKVTLYTNLQALYQCVQNKDLISVIDIMKYDIHPIICRCLKGSEAG